MSVAFRRDSDDEHLEPKFDLPLSSLPRADAQIRARVAELEAELAGLIEETAIKAARRQLRYWSARQAQRSSWKSLMALASLLTAP